jgi:hypothetical protein
MFPFPPTAQTTTQANWRADQSRPDPGQPQWPEPPLPRRLPLSLQVCRSRFPSCNEGARWQPRRRVARYRADQRRGARVAASGQHVDGKGASSDQHEWQGRALQSSSSPASSAATMVRKPAGRRRNSSPCPAQGVPGKLNRAIYNQSWFWNVKFIHIL